MSSYTPASNPLHVISSASLTGIRIPRTWLVLTAAILLISVPVFIQAPLVRYFPWIGLLATGGWLMLSRWLYNRPATHLWGDLLTGFTWTWLAGALYWGWLRWEPLLHLPVEAIGLPFAVVSLIHGRDKVGNWFYLGSLFGTTVTDMYFYLVNLIPHWRRLMQVSPEMAQPILHNAVAHMQTPWGTTCAVALLLTLLGVGYLPLCSRQLHWWAFGGAVLSTILVDGLFWLAAIVA